MLVFSLTSPLRVPVDALLSAHKLMLGYFRELKNISKALDNVDTRLQYHSHYVQHWLDVLINASHFLLSRTTTEKCLKNCAQKVTLRYGDYQRSIESNYIS